MCLFVIIAIGSSNNLCVFVGDHCWVVAIICVYLLEIITE